MRIQNFLQPRRTSIGYTLQYIQLQTVAQKNGIRGNSEDIHEEGANDIANDKTHLKYDIIYDGRS